eukprot:1241851-Alexandrium_andersonii.AAC.1
MLLLLTRPFGPLSDYDPPGKIAADCEPPGRIKASAAEPTGLQLRCRIACPARGENRRSSAPPGGGTPGRRVQRLRVP